MQKEKNCISLLIVLCVVFVLLAFSYVYIPPWLMLSTRQAVHEPRRGSHSYYHSGFVLVLRYNGQQGAGVVGVKSVQRRIKDLGLPMMSVEPFLQNSVMGIHPQKKGEEQSVKFSDVFDMDSFNTVSRSEGSPEMIAWSDYITNAPREAVFIKMIHVANEDSFEGPTILPTISNGTSKCSVRTITAPDNTSVSLCQVREARAHWKPGDTCTLSDEDMYGSILRGLHPANVTLIFSFWPVGVRKVATNPREVHNVRNNDSSTDQDYKFQASPKLHHYMEIYQNNFLTAPGERESRYVAVMIRAEHSVIQFKMENSSNISANIEDCLHQLQDKTNEAMRAVGTSKLLVTSDVGYYGSGSWYAHKKTKAIQQRVKIGIERLYEGREEWSFEQWEQSFIETLGGVTDRGYVAALQRVLAASNKTACLVLMGGGRFQELSLENYLHHTRHQPHARYVHLVCIQMKYAKSFNSMLARD